MLSRRAEAACVPQAVSSGLAASPGITAQQAHEGGTRLRVIGAPFGVLVNDGVDDHEADVRRLAQALACQHCAGG